jgi:hypothetical protein
MAAAPQFCPWCGTPIAYRPHDREPRYEALARERGAESAALPERVRELLAGEAFVGVCESCRRVSHVVGHRAGP